jgi:hypothetical protein
LKNSEIKFKTFFSLGKLIKFWEKRALEAENIADRNAALDLVNKVKSFPELNTTITDKTIFKRHKSLFERLSAAVIPLAYNDTNLQAIVSPDEFRAVYCTERFKNLFCDDEGNFSSNLNINEELFDKGSLISIFSAILNNFYGINMPIVYPIIKTITDKNTGLERYFKMNLDNRFMEMKIKGELPEIKNEDIVKLSENILDITAWNELIPLNIFESEGFMVVNMFEVTDQEALSFLKQDLLKKDILSSENGFEKIQHRIRTIFRNQRLKLGITAISDESERLLNSGFAVGNSFLLNNECISHCKNYKDSIYENAFVTKKPQIIYDLEAYQKCSPLEKAIAQQGIRNILVVGLEYEGKQIGILELGSPVAGDINSVNSIKLLDVMSLFAVALQRNLDEIESRIQSIIKEKCTAIHPSVEWRFRKAAFNMLEKTKTDEYADMEDIVFKDVYPVYALSDIRNSSLIRNQAIQSDLKHNLLLAREIVKAAILCKEMPVLELLNYRIEEKILMLDSGLHTGDETSIISFLKREIEPLFPMVSGLGRDVEMAVNNYKYSIDKELGFYYNKRRDFEESVQKLNDVIAEIVDEEEVMAQSVYPHYFEKYKTDGIEYTIYIGDSISENKRFDEFYLKNIRVWQLLMMCRIARKAEELKNKLSVKVELAHLILVLNNPLSVRFHYDQKRFDVDGTYNIHYEIMKKRIDKAEIRGSSQRLTQPGKLAIVYAQPSEANEYRTYIKYLQARGFFEDGIEELELNDLQGVYGLRALRVNINLLPVKLKQDIDIEKIIKQMAITDK